MTIYLDFDGTVVEHRYPYIGNIVADSFMVIRKLQKAGHEIILNTYRADCSDGTLEEAIQFLNKSKEIEPITQFEKQKITPNTWNWDNHNRDNIIFIDDICPEIPMDYIEETFSEVVDWYIIDKEFIENGIY